jgi:hypothetical protein
LKAASEAEKQRRIDMEALFVAIALATVALGCAYFLGKDTARTEEQKLVAEVLSTFNKDEAAAKAFVSKFLGSIKLDYTRAYSAVVAELERFEAAAKKVGL